MGQIKFMSYAMILALACLSGCASAGRSDGCGYRSLIGKNVYSADLDAVRASGKEVRLLYPDSYLGFKSDPNRVNVTRDDNGEIVDVTCG